MPSTCAAELYHSSLSSGVRCSFPECASHAVAQGTYQTNSDNGMILNVFSWLVLLRDTKERKKNQEFEKEALLCKTFVSRALLIGVSSLAFPDVYSLLGCHQVKYSLISHEIQPLKALTWADGGPAKMLKLSQSVSLNFCSGINCCCVCKEMSYLSAMQFNVLRMLWCFACHV